MTELPSKPMTSGCPTPEGALAGDRPSTEGAAQQIDVLVIIAARGGSKGVPGKNLAEVGGVPLVGRAVRTGRTVAQLLRAQGLRAMVLVDSDSDEIREAGRRWGADLVLQREPHLASDEAATVDTVRAAIPRVAGATTSTAVVLLQCTSPFTTADHVLACISEFHRTGDHVVSVVESAHPLEWAWRVDGGEVSPVFEDAPTRRQLAPSVFFPSGAVYVTSAAGLMEHGFVRRGHTRAIPSGGVHVDIDTPPDLELARALAAAPSRTAFNLGRRRIGSGQPCYVIAEAGVNHNGDLAVAHRLVEAAAGAGADAVKFQTFRAELVVARETRAAAYQVATTGARSQYDLLRSLELPEAWHFELRDHAHSLGLEFLSTAHDPESLEFLVHEVGIPAVKLGSGDIENPVFLRLAGSFGLPVILSTGMSELPDIESALSAVRTGGATEIAVLHCVSAYPAPLEHMNVRALTTLRAAFGLPVGLSDHCEDVEPALAAIGIGCDIWEKHLTLDRSLPGPDHRASLEPEEFARQIAALRRAELALGSGGKSASNVEADVRQVVRKHLAARRNLMPGAIIGWDDLIGVRSHDGIPASAVDALIGRRLARPVPALDLLDYAALAEP